MKVRRFLRNINHTLLLTVLVGTLAACEKGPKLIPEIAGTDFTVSSFQGKVPAEWVLGTGNELRTKSFNWSIAGACSGAVKAVKVSINSVESGTEANCENGSYSWVKSSAVMADGSYNVEVIPYNDVGVEVAGKKISHVVQVDNVAPSAISLSEILHYQGGSLVNQAISSGASVNLMIDEDSDGCTGGLLGVRLTGTYTPDNDPAVFDSLVITPAGGTTSHSGNNFEFRFCMTSGENRSVTIQALDDLGNASNLLTAAISASSPMTSIKVGGSFNPGFSGSSIAAEPGQSSGGLTLVSVHMGNVLSQASVGSATLATGFTNVLSQVSP